MFVLRATHPAGPPTRPRGGQKGEVCSQKETGAIRANRQNGRLQAVDTKERQKGTRASIEALNYNSLVFLGNYS